jgi:YD repeat-containing protein
VNVNRNYSSNGLNQYTQGGSTSDANGNFTFDGSNSFSYDVENRLVKMVQAGGTVNVAYDPLGRLFQVDVGGTASSTTKFLYDGDALVAEYNSTGATLKARYVHGSNAAADDPLVWYPSSLLSSKRYLHGDHLGSIIAVTNASGAPSVSSYDEFGIPPISPTTGLNTNSGRFQYTG